jgi:hypothetical protein
MSTSAGSPSIEIFQLLFEEGWYLDRHPDALAVGGLEHFLAVGDASGYWPHPLFDPGYYGSQHPELAEQGGARFAHYLQHGGRDGSNPHPLFDAQYYSARNPDLAQVDSLLPHPLFDPTYYGECESAACSEDAIRLALPPSRNPLLHR